MRLITYFGQDESKTTLTLHSKFECENVRGYKNLDVFSKFVEQSFQSFLTHKRKKTVYIAGLSFVLFHLCKMIQEDESEHLTVVFNPFDFDKDRCKEKGRVFAFSKDTSRNDKYSFNKMVFSHSTLIKCVSHLEDKGWLIHEKGWVYSRQHKLGFEFINYSKFYPEFYVAVREIFWQIVSFRKCIDTKKNYIEIRQSKEVIDDNGKGSRDVITLNGNLAEYRGRTIIKNSKKLLKRLDDMYTSISVSLRDFDQVDPSVQDAVKRGWSEKREQRFDRKVINKEVTIYNSRVSANKDFPRRVFHLDSNDDLQWGRIYGNKGGIDHLYSYLTPLLAINGEPTIEIDIKSCVLQMFVLNNCPRVDNKQDFYSYECLKETGITREQVKLLTQCLLNNGSKEDARKSFSYTERMKLSQKDFNLIVEKMLDERKYFKSLFLHPNKAKQTIRMESDFMCAVMDRLLDKGLQFIYHFDSIFVRDKDCLTTLEIINQVAMDKWNKSLNATLSRNL